MGDLEGHGKGEQQLSEGFNLFSRSIPLEPNKFPALL
jgi:hypothetical protein